MSHTSQKRKSQKNKIIRYLMICFYFIFIGFCLVGIWLKWDASSGSGKNYTTHVYEEGLDAITVAVPLPDAGKKESFLECLSRRAAKKPAPVIHPQRDDRAEQTWQKYAALPVNVPAGNAEIILVIDDLGIVKGTTKQMIEMNVPLTLSFLPYATEIATQVNEAYLRGHDILVHIPMEPKGKADPGPHALLSSSSADNQMESIDYNLGQFSNYIGINNHMGSRFTEDEEAVNRFLDVIKTKGLLVLDSKTTANSRLEKLAIEKNIPVTDRDVFLDNEQDINYILGQLGKLERIAKRDGSALAIGHPYAQTVAALKEWIPTLADKGITIIPISQKVREKYASTSLAAD